MALRDPRDEIVIFDGGAGGYGDAVDEGRASYHSAYNWDCTRARAVPALAPIIVGAVNTEEVTCAFELDETTGRPLILVGSGDGSTIANVYRLRDGSYDLDGNDAAASAPVLSGVLFRHDGTDPDAPMAYFTRDGTAVVWQRNRSGVYADAGHTADLTSIWVVAGTLWAVDSTGYQVQRLTLDSDPGLTASYQTAIPVGLPTYAVNAIVGLGGSPVVAKGDGLFIYNAATGEFDNLLKAITPHPDNGKGTFTDGRGRLYYPTVDGHLVVFSFGFQTQQQPTRFATIDRDTPWGRVTAMTADMDHVYGAIEPGQTAVWGQAAAASLGLTVIADDGGVRTNETTDVTDGQFSTVANLTLLTTGDFLFVGAEEPFHSIYVRLYAKRTATGVSALTVAYSSAANTFTAAAGSHDSTTMFAQDGTITVQNSTSGDLPTLSASPWISTTAYAGSATKYWMRIAFNSAMTGAQIAELGIIPYRPPLSTSLFPESAYWRSGSLPVIVVGRWEGQRLVWHPVWTLDAPKVQQMLVARGFCGALEGRRGLYCFTQERVHMMPVGADSHPSRAGWPKLGDYGEATTASDPHLIQTSAVDFEGHVVCLEGPRFEIPFVQEDDALWVYQWLDEDAERVTVDGPFAVRSFQAAPCEGSGKRLNIVLAFSDGSRDAVAPYIEKISLAPNSWKYIDEPIARSTIASPQAR